MTATTDNSSTTIMPALCVVDGQITTTSNQVAEHFGKEHKQVLRTIRNLLKELPEKHQRNFAPMLFEVEVGGGAIRKDPAYRLTRDAFTLLAMGFTGKEALRWKLAYIDTFNKMEAELLEQMLEQMLASRPAIDYTRISPAQAQALSELVIAETKRTGKHYKTVWGSFNRHFRVNSYHELPATHFDEACQWLGGKRIATKAAPATSYDVPAVDFDFKAELTTGQSDAKPLSSAIMVLVQQCSWRLAGEAQVSILQFLERFIAYRTNDATRNNVSHITRLLEPLTLSHCLAHRYFSEIGRVQQMADVVEQMAIACTQGIRRRMGTVFA